jgi:excisionase family DNA binding protein
VPKIIDHAAALAGLHGHLAAIPAESLPADVAEHVAAALRAAEHFLDAADALHKVRTQPTISVDEYSAVIGVDRQTAYAAAKRGDIPTVGVGRRVRVPSAPVRRLLGLDEVA